MPTTTPTIRETYCFSFPGLPAKLNEFVGRHWSVGHKLKARDRWLIEIAAQNAGVPRANGKRRVSLHIVMGPRNRQSDADAFWKSILDGLVAARLLTTDSPAGVDHGPVTFERGAKAETWITLEDAEP